MPRPYEPDFTQKDIGVDTPFPIPQIGDNIQQTLAHLIGFFEQENRFKLLRVDNQGRLHITPGAVSTNSWVLSQFSVLFATPTQVLSEDANRREFYLDNEGLYPIRIHSDNTVSVTKGILIPANGGFTMNTYYGNLWVYAINGSCKVTVLDIR
jgi:hypothetical protein